MSNIGLLLDINRGWGWNLVRNIFGWLDVVVYTVFSWVMQLLVDITHFNTTSQFGSFYANIQSRIFVMLSIYMLFKVIISILNYIVNPDSLTDKSQGASKLVQRIIIVLVLLIAIAPTNSNNIFVFLDNFQSHVIDDKTIMKVVLGSNSSAVSNMEAEGQKIGLSIYNGTFFKYNGGPIYDVDGVDVDSVDDLVWMINDPEEGNANSYKFEYYPLIGTAVGVIMDILILSICVDIAIRVFKLIILQVIAPIPIISYIDPKSSKDGAFSKWLKLFISTWVEIFIKLFLVYFVVYLIDNIIENASSLTGNSTSPFVTITLIIGLLFFAKNAPKFIFDALGMKAPERGMFAGFGNILAAGAIAGGAIGAGVGIARNGISTDKSKGKFGVGSVIKNVGAGIFGSAGGLATGVWAAGTAKDHQAKAVMDARNKYLANQLAGNTLGYRAKSTLSNLLLGGSDSSAMDRQIAGYDDAFNKFKNLKTTAEDKMSENANFRRTVKFNHNGTKVSLNNANFKEINQQLTRANNGDAAAQAWFTAQYGIDYKTVDLHMNDIKDSFTSEYITLASNGGADGTTRGMLEYAMSGAKDIGYTLDVSRGSDALDNVKAGMGAASEGARKIKVSDDYKKQHSGGKK